MNTLQSLVLKQDREADCKRLWESNYRLFLACFGVEITDGISALHVKVAERAPGVEFHRSDLEQALFLSDTSDAPHTKRWRRYVDVCNRIREAGYYVPFGGDSFGRSRGNDQIFLTRSKYGMAGVILRPLISVETYRNIMGA